MREIKFRAWNKVNKTMYDSAIYNCKDTFDMILKHPQIYEVMQYTGLKDKNGEEIYEGDIVEIKYKKYAFDGETLVDKYVKGYIKYNYFSFDICIDNNDEIDCYSGFIQEQMLIGDAIDEEWEVVGNIYENPKILENNL